MSQTKHVETQIHDTELNRFDAVALYWKYFELLVAFLRVYSNDLTISQIENITAMTAIGSEMIINGSVSSLVTLRVILNN